MIFIKEEGREGRETRGEVKKERRRKGKGGREAGVGGGGETSKNKRLLGCSLDNMNH